MQLCMVECLKYSSECLSESDDGRRQDIEVSKEQAQSAKSNQTAATRRGEAGNGRQFSVDSAFQGKEDAI